MNFVFPDVSHRVPNAILPNVVFIESAMLRVANPNKDEAMPQIDDS